MKAQQLVKAAEGLHALPETAIVYMLFVEEKKHIIEVAGKTDPKGTDFYSMTRKVDSNPFQAVIVDSKIKDIKPDTLIYISHRYYPYPMIHNGVIFHKIQLNDIIAIVDISKEERKKRIELESGVGKTWSDEPSELTRKDVLT